MTTPDTTPESLIGEAKNYEGDNGTARWPSLIVDLAAALSDAQTKLAERDAVISEAKRHIERPFRGDETLYQRIQSVAIELERVPAVRTAVNPYRAKQIGENRG